MNVRTLPPAGTNLQQGSLKQIVYIRLTPVIQYFRSFLRVCLSKRSLATDAHIASDGNR